MKQSEQSKPGSFWDWLQRILLIMGFLTAMAGFLDYTSNTKTLRVISISAFLVYFLASLWFAFNSESRLVWKWTSLIALYIFTALFCFWIGGWQNDTTPKSFSNNLVKKFNFEDGLPKNISLGICDNTPNWYNVCYDAPTRIKVVSGGYTGQKSLDVQIEILPEKEQVYSLRLPVSPPAFADAVSANVYIANIDKFSKITLAARIKGENVWVFSDMKPDKDGWLYFLVDLQGYKGDNSARDIAIDEIHIDMFARAGNQIMEDERILLDDIELYYPLSPSRKTGP
jgi:hypothetical protein